MFTKNIFERDLSGEQINLNDPEYYKLKEIQDETWRLVSEINTIPHSPEEVKNLFAQLTGAELDDLFCLWVPFYTDFGKNIKIGKRVFINSSCTFMDRGGITIEDDVLIGPKVNLITTNHPLEPKHRRSTISKPIVIKKNAWIATGVIINPGVTIGENSVVGGGAVVTHDVPPNTVVAGVPAKVIRRIE